MPPILQGIARAYRVDMWPWLSHYGLQVMRTVSTQCVAEFQSRFGGLELADLFKPAFADPFTVPVFAQVANRALMGRDGLPGHPVFYRVGVADGIGDTIIVAADMRQLAYLYCRRGVSVDYAELPGLEHLGAAVTHYAQASLWLRGRFDGAPSTSTCASIRTGSSIAPLPVARQRTSLTSSTRARPRIRPDVFVTTGRLRLPADALQQCTGRITTVLTRNGRVISRGSARLRDDCTYQVHTRLPDRHKPRHSRWLRLKVAFTGTAQHHHSSTSRYVWYRSR